MLDHDIAKYVGTPPVLPALTEEIVGTLRAGMREAGRLLPAPEIDTVCDLDAEGVPLRLYRPSAPAPLPLLVFLHGGGWMLGDLETHDAIHRMLAERAGCAVIAVDYRLAPEHPFPAAVDDVANAWKWIRHRALELGCDPAKIALGGESAGANLAAALAIQLRDREQDQPLFQLLVHPATELRLSLPSLDEVTAPGLSRDYLEQCVAMYLAGADATNPLASPLCASDHRGLAPAIILTAEEDPLRDDGEYYARALAASGVETLCRRLSGLPHGFLFLPATIPPVSRAFDEIAALIRRYFAVQQS